jgi:iron complex outermembrane recepter protein
MRQYLSLIIFFFSFIGFSQDCTYVLLGEVIDFHEKTPLNGARIAITGKDRATTTNADGKFKFTGLCNGVLELEISHPECTTEFMTLTMEGDHFERILLEHHLEELDEVRVTGRANPKKTNSSQEQVVTERAMEQYSGGSLGDALKSITGVSSLNTGATIVKPIIQGLSGSRILILNNNVRMQDMEWGDEHAPNVDVNANQRVSVIKGAAALEHGGDAIGGVIILESAPLANKDTLFGRTQLNAFSNGRGGNITTSLTRTYDNGLFIKGQGSFKYLGDMETPDYILSNTGIQEKGLSFALGKRAFVQGWEAYYSYFNADIGILRASHIGNVDDLIQSINNRVPNFIEPFTYTINRPNQDVTHHLAKASYYRRFEGLGKWEVQYDFQQNHRLEFDIRVGSDANKASLDLRLTTHTLSSTFKVDAYEKMDLKFGAMGRYQNNFANPDTGVRRLIPDYDKYDAGGFGIAEFKWNDGLVLDAGLRYDFSRIDAKKFYRTSRWEERGYDVDFPSIILEDLGTQLLTNPIFNYHNVSVTTGLKKDLGNDHTVRFNYSLSNRAPNPSELFSDGLHHSAARIELGDLRLQSESASKFSASLEKTGNNWGYTLAPYVNHISNFLLLEPSNVEFTIRGAFPVWSYRQTTALFLGVDASIYKQWLPQLRTDHSFSYVHGTDTDLNIPLIHMPAPQFVHSISYNNPGWENFTIALTSQYVMEQTRFPENIFVFSPIQDQEVELDINTAPEAYHLLGLDAQMVLDVVHPQDLTLGLRVTNLMNTNYRDYLNRQRFFVDDLARNISLRLIYNY